MLVVSYCEPFPAHGIDLVAVRALVLCSPGRFRSEPRDDAVQSYCIVDSIHDAYVGSSLRSGRGNTEARA